jgi:hypothetical protein
MIAPGERGQIVDFYSDLPRISRRAAGLRGDWAAAAALVHATRLLIGGVPLLLDAALGPRRLLLACGQLVQLDDAAQEPPLLGKLALLR